MSVLIKGVKLPKSCFGCHLFKLDDQDLWCIANHYAGCCRVLSKYIDEDKFVKEKHPDCPLIEVTTPHGRLGDLDELVKTLEQNRLCYVLDVDDESFELGIDKAISIVKDAPTVIEAEE